MDGKQLQKPKEPVIKSLEEFLIDRIPGQSPVHHLEVGTELAPCISFPKGENSILIALGCV